MSAYNNTVAPQLVVTFFFFNVGHKNPPECPEGVLKCPTSVWGSTLPQDDADIITARVIWSEPTGPLRQTHCHTFPAQMDRGG